MKKLIILLMCIVALQLNAQTITNYTTADGLLSDFVECIDVDINDNVWLGTSIGVQMFDGSSLAVYDVANYPGMLSDNIKVITAMSNGEIWIGTDYGANQLVSGVNGFMWLPYTTSNGPASNQVKSIDEDANGGIWVGTNQGVSYFDGNSWISYSSPDLHWSGVNATAFDSNGDKWFASPLGGITHFNGTTFTPYDTSNGLLSQYVTALKIDDQDNKWVGTSSGMSVLDATNTTFTKHTRMYIMPPPDTLNPVVDIAMDSHERIWTAIYVGYLAVGGVAMWDGNQWIDFDVTDGLVGPNVKGLAIDSQDNIWVATSTGVSKISAIPSAVSAIKNNGFDLFPNPSSDKIYITNENQKIQQLKIYNNLGALVYENNSNQLHYSIDVSPFSKGLYYVNVLSFDAILTKKIMVN
jgi:ligand-binding sensor domain-containing protein